MTDLTQAAQDVLAERSRQQVEEGFQPAQDDGSFLRTNRSVHCTRGDRAAVVQNKMPRQTIFEH